MTLSITSPATGSRVGPGVQIQLATTLGPTAVDDVFSVIVTLPGAFESFVYGDALARGFTFGIVTLGKSQINAPATFAAPLKGLADNTTMDINAFLSHHSGAVVESVNVAGFKWDATTGLWWLLVQAGGLSGGPLTEILDAVRIKKTTPGQI